MAFDGAQVGYVFLARALASCSRRAALSVVADSRSLSVSHNRDTRRSSLLVHLPRTSGPSLAPEEEEQDGRQTVSLPRATT